MKAEISKLIIALSLMILPTAWVNAQVILKIVPPDPDSLFFRNRCIIHLINTEKLNTPVVLLMELEHDSLGLVYKAISSRKINFAIPHQIIQWDTLAIRVVPLDEQMDQIRDRSAILSSGFYTLCLYAIEPKKQKEFSRDCLQMHIR